jgi:hypothetical protein
MPVITALKKQRQGDVEFQANLGYIAKLCLIETKTKQKKVN